MKALIVGLDIGTSGIKAVAFKPDGDTAAEGKYGIDVHMTESGFAEQNPSDWWEGTVLALRRLAEKLGPDVRHVKAIGLAGQCPSFTLLYPSGETVDFGMLYMDNRAVAETELLLARYGAKLIHERTGEAPSQFYILPKLIWLQRHQPEALADGAYVLQPRDYVGWKLTGQLATDPTHAACTLGYDIRAGRWMNEWMTELGLGSLKFPDVMPCDAKLGCISEAAAASTGFPQGIPVIVGGADSLCAVHGTPSFGEGILCDISGTSTCLHLLVGEPVADYSVNTYPHVVSGQWCAEAGVNTTGAALKWLADTLQLSYDRLFHMVEGIKPGAEGLFFLPHLANGERDEPGRSGAFVGLKLHHTRAHLARAVLEGIAFALRMRIERLKRSVPITRVISSGGGALGEVWNRIKADLFALPVEAVLQADTTALGAARLAASNIGMMMEQTALSAEFHAPDPHNAKIYDKLYDRFLELEDKLTNKQQT